MDAFVFPPLEELTFPNTWERNDKEEMLAEDEALNVRQWRDYIIRQDDDNTNHDKDTDLMEIDRPLLGSRFLVNDDDEDDDDNIMGGASCDSPTGPLEELDSNEPFLTPLMLLDADGTTDDYNIMMMDDVDGDVSIIAMPFEERYKATLQKLAASMKRSQETRNCLTMKTIKTESYERLESVQQIVSAIASSSSQIQNYVTSIRRQV
jgi:hypothetical protein